MHSLLAISAFHLSHVSNGLTNRNHYFSIANIHHEKALISFRSTVGSVHNDNGIAIAAFSLLTVIFFVGVPVVFGFQRTNVPTTSFLDIIRTLRGARLTILPVLSCIKESPLGALIDLAPPNPHRGQLCPMNTRGLRVLAFFGQYLEASTNYPKQDKAIYREALDQLVMYLHAIQDVPPLWANALIWPSIVSPSFFELLCSKRPFALVLLACWCVPFYRAPSMWFNSWARHIVGGYLAYPPKHGRKRASKMAGRAGRCNSEGGTSAAVSVFGVWRLRERP